MKKEKNNDFMKMLAPRSTEEFEEILKKYPLSDENPMQRTAECYGKGVNMKKREVFTVENLNKSSVYKRYAAYAAAALLIVTGIAGIAAMNSDRNSINEPLSDAVSTETASESDGEISVKNGNIPFELIEDYEGMNNVDIECRIIRSYEELKAFELVSSSSEESQEEFKVKASPDIYNDEYFEENALIFFIKQFPEWTRKLPEINSVCRENNIIIINAERDIANDEEIQTWYGFIGISKDSIDGIDTVELDIGSPDSYSVDMIDSGSENSAVYSNAYELAPVTDEWLKSVFFSAYYPYIIYADKNTCIFTEGAESIFIADLDKHEITFSANIRETLENAGFENMGIEAWNGISFYTVQGSENIELICSVTYADSTKEYYLTDISSGRLLYAEPFEDELIPPPDTAKNTAGLGIDYAMSYAATDNGGYVCLANNGLVPFRIGMIDIERYTEKNGIERFRPFETYSEYQTVGTGLKIKIPYDFELNDSSDSSDYMEYKKILENNDIVYISYFSEPTESEMNDLREMHKNEISPTAAVSEEDEYITGFPFVHKHGKFEFCERGNPYTNGYFENYYGIVPYVDDTRLHVSIIIRSNSENPETVQYIQELMKIIAYTAWTEIPC